MSIQVLYISYDGMTDPLGQSQVIPYLAGLSAKGYHITLLSAEKEENYTLHKNTIAKLLKHNSIRWEPISYTKSPPIVSTIRDINALKKKAKELHHNSDFQIIHCRSYISAFVGFWMKKQYNCKFVFDMRGFWPDERVDGKIWDLQNPLFKLVYRFFKKKEKQFLNAADHVISLTNAGKTEMLKWKLPHLKAEQISVIPCCADLDHFDYKKVNTNDQSALNKELQIPEDAYVISYLGSVGTWYMLDEMLEFFKHLLEKKDNAIFLFITKDKPEQILEKAAALGLAKEKFIIRPAERKQVPNFISLCDASIFFIKPVWSKKASSPTKMAELMGMGIPIVANAGVGDVDQIINENPTGILMHTFSSDAYEKAIDELIQCTHHKSEEVRQLACDNFSLDQGIYIFDTLYKQLS